MMGVRLGDKPLANFSDPIQMMEDCHRRIEHFLAVFQKVAVQFGDGKLTDEGRRALAASLDYFTSAAPRHTADEEQSLFPRVRRSEHSFARLAMSALDRLEDDHRRCEVCHALVDELVRGWLEIGSLDAVQRQRLQSLLDELMSIYTAHIEVEEQQIFPIASTILKSEQIREIGDEMRRRRSLRRVT
jgi:hemerythrin-like domain-containing protein